MIIIKPFESISSLALPRSFPSLNSRKSMLVIAAVALACVAYLYTRLTHTPSPWRKVPFPEYDNSAVVEVNRLFTAKTGKFETVKGTEESFEIPSALLKNLKGMESIRLNGETLWDKNKLGNSNDQVISAYKNEKLDDRAIKLLAESQFQALERLAKVEGMTISEGGHRAVITTRGRMTHVALLRVFKQKAPFGVKLEPGILVKREIRFSEGLQQVLDAVAVFPSVYEAKQLLLKLEA